MSNPLKPRPMDKIIAELQRMGWSRAAWTAFRDVLTRIDKVLTDRGEVQASANVTGRTEQLGTTVSGLAATGDINATTKVVGRAEGIGTTVTHLDATGKLTSTDAIAADGTGSPLTGGKRGFVALGSDNRLTNSFRQKGVNVTSVPTSATVLSNTGVGHLINMAAWTANFASGSVSYNSASFDPGAFGSYFVFANDPGFAGGAVTPFGSLLAEDQTTYEDIVGIGKITTAGGSATTGGGKTGGTTPGGIGGRGYVKE